MINILISATTTQHVYVAATFWLRLHKRWEGTDALTERATRKTNGTQAVGVALGVTSDYLLHGATDEVAKARFADRELLQQFQEVEQFAR